jgi:hypothetical protein
VVLEIPDLGAGRYSTNKVRMESQTLISDLSSKGRATKKAFDQSPTDSNRVGLFFSPTKELNIDIAKSFGGINLDNYIGDPSDSYKSNYKITFLFILIISFYMIFESMFQRNWGIFIICFFLYLSFIIETSSIAHRESNKNQ